MNTSNYLLTCKGWILRWLLVIGTFIFCDTQNEPRPDRRIKVGVFPDTYHLALQSVTRLKAEGEISLVRMPIANSTRAMNRLVALYNQINHLEPDVIVGPYDEMVGLALTRLDRPYIVTTGGVHDGLSFEILPHPDDICDVVLDVIREYGWRKIGFIFESEADFKIIERLLDERSIDIKFWKMTDDSKDAMRSLLLANRDKGMSETVVMMSSTKTRKLLRIARRLGMINPINRWLILNMESADVSNRTLDHIKTNVTTINLVRQERLRPDLQQPRPGGYIIPPVRQDDSSLEAVVMTDAMNTILEAFKLLPSTMKNKSEIPMRMSRALPKVCFEGLTGLVEFDPYGRRINLTFDIYRFKMTKFVKVGDWVSRTQIVPRLSFPTPVPDRSNKSIAEFPLKGKKIRVVTILEKPFTMYVDDYEEKNLKGNARFKGFAVDLMSEIARMLDFQFELYLVPDGKFGSRNPDGTWNGMIGEVLAQRAAMTVAPLSINAEREKVIDFTKPFKTRGITVLMRTPKSHPSYFQFLKPLSPYVWLCTILAVATVSVALYGLERYAVSDHAPVSGQTMDVQESCWFIFGSLVQGGTDSSPGTIGGRILTSAWWLFALMMVSTYTANLAAFLTVKKIQPPISSVTDLAGQTAIKFGTVRNSGVETFFKNTKIQAFANMRTHMTELFPNAMVNTTQEGLKRAKGEDYAFLWDNTVTSYMASIDCDYTEIGPPFDPKGFGLAVPSGVTYREALSIAILKLGDQGRIVELEHKYWNPSKCDSQENSATDLTSELRLENVAGIFFILVAGMILAFSACAISSLCNKRKFRRNNRRPK